MQTLPKILLVEDDRGIAGALAVALKSEYAVQTAGTGKMAIIKAEAEDYSIIVLDLNLPDISGLAVCQQLRNRGLVAPILVLSGEAKTLSKITMLDAGANDYLTKPFSLGEFKARLRVLSRAQTAAPPKIASRILSVGDVVLDRQAYTVHRAGVPINLRRKEFSLLECLLEHAGQAVSRNTLGHYAWDGAGELWTNTIDVHINHLRVKLDRPFSTPLIHTVHGRGYKLVAVQTDPIKVRA